MSTEIVTKDKVINLMTSSEKIPVIWDRKKKEMEIANVKEIE